MNLSELIAFYEAKLQNPDLTQGSRNIAKETLRELEGKRELLKRINYDMLQHECCGRCKR